MKYMFRFQPIANDWDTAFLWGVIQKVGEECTFKKYTSLLLKIRDHHQEQDSLMTLKHVEVDKIGKDWFRGEDDVLSVQKYITMFK